MSAETVALMKDVKPVGTSGNYGLGLEYQPGLGYGHTGGHTGYLTDMRYDPTQEVAVVISASVLNWDDMLGEFNCLFDICRAAKNILGYSTAEAY